MACRVAPIIPQAGRRGVALQTAQQLGIWKRVRRLVKLVNGRLANHIRARVRPDDMGEDAVPENDRPRRPSDFHRLGLFDPGHHLGLYPIVTPQYSSNHFIPIFLSY